MSFCSLHSNFRDGEGVCIFFGSLTPSHSACVFVCFCCLFVVVFVIVFGWGGGVEGLLI